MNVQNSYAHSNAGKLYIVPTPIGNLADMTYRAVETLQRVTIIAAEDTRHTKKLLNYYNLDTPLISYHEHNEKQRSEELVNRLLQGDNIALVSDAGMPGISDPGHVLIKHAINEAIDIIVLPGANAALTALVGSGLATDQFLFYGFLPRKAKAKRDVLTSLKNKRATLIFYESPFRVKDTVTALYEQLGERQIVIARELTKQYETYIRGTLSEIVAWLTSNEIIGECCLIVSGNIEDKQRDDRLWWSPFSVQQHVAHYVEHEQLSTKDAIKRVAEDRQMKRREVYQMYHQQ